MKEWPDERSALMHPGRMLLSIFSRTASLVAVLVILSLLHASRGETSIRSVRTGIQPEGARLAIDLDRYADYSISKEGDRLRVDVRTGIQGAVSERFPANKVALAFSAQPENGGTTIVIDLSSPGVVARHYTLPDPERIVIDLSPGGQSEGQGLQADGIIGLHGLIPAPVTHGPGPHTFDLYLPREDISIGKGSFVRTFFFETSPLWRIKEGSFLNLVLKTGDLEEDVLFRIMLTLNGHPVDTVIAEPAGVKPTGTVIPIPPRLFREGRNVMTLSASAGSKDRQYGGGIKNLGIHGNSLLRLSYLPVNDLRVGDLASPFKKAVITPGEDLAVVIPDSPEPGEIEAALEILLSWSREAGGVFLPRVILLNELDNRTADKFHLVYLGRISAIPRYVLESFGTKNSAGGESTLSSFLNIQGKARLLLTSGSAEGVLLGARSLLDPELAEKMDTRRIVVGPGAVPSEESPGRPGNDIPFGRLAGGDVLFSGTGSQEKSFVIGLPPEEGLKGKPELVLSYRYSPVLDNLNSTISVEFGDVSARTVPLGKNNSGEGRLAVEIPRTLPETRSLNLKLKVSLLELENEKGKSLGDAAWLVVDSTSRLVLPVREGSLPLLLENFPYAFHGKAITVYAGDGMNGEMITALARMLISWDRDLPRDIRTKAEPLSSFSWEDPRGSTIIIASFAELLRSGAPLAVGYDETSGRIRPGRKVPVKKEHEEGSVCLQVLGAKGGEPVFLMGWPAKKSDAEIFPESFNFRNLRGDVSFISDSGGSVSFYVNTPEPGAGFLRSRPGLRIFLGLFALGLSLALLALFVYHIRLKYQPRPPADDPGA